MSAGGIFIAGTDTGVGKTEIACAVLQLLAERGLKPRGLKPVETGCTQENPEDALRLREASGAPNNALSLEQVCPHRFLLPAAPLVAARAEGREVEIARIDACVKSARENRSPLVVEAAGGLLVPLWRESGRVLTNLDLAARIGLPVLLVGRAGLGTINHCALSAQALALRGISVSAIVLNRTTQADDPSVETNAAAVGELTGCEVVGPGGFEIDRLRRTAALARLLAPAVAKIWTL